MSQIFHISRWRTQRICCEMFAAVKVFFDQYIQEDQVGMVHSALIYSWWGKEPKTNISVDILSPDVQSVGASWTRPNGGERSAENIPQLWACWSLAINLTGKLACLLPTVICQPDGNLSLTNFTWNNLWHLTPALKRSMGCKNIGKIEKEPKMPQKSQKVK